MSDETWKEIEELLGGWAAPLVAGLDDTDRHQLWLATKALLRRQAGGPGLAARLSVESAFEAALQRLRGARAGDERSQQAFGRLVTEGYLLDREDRLADFVARLDRRSSLAVSALACLAHRQRALAPAEAVRQARRIAFDRDHHPELLARDQAGATLRTVLSQLERSASLQRSVRDFVTAHLGRPERLVG